MRALFPTTVLVLSSLSAGACTTHYYPMNPTASILSDNDYTKYRLENAELALTCTYRDSSNDVQPAPKLCALLKKLFSLEQGTIVDSLNAVAPEGDEGGSAKTEGRVMDRLHVGVELHSPATRYSNFDHTLLWMTYWFYPAETDRWQTISVRVFDREGRPLQQGQFKALMRTHYGWGYWLSDRVMTWLGRTQPECCEKNSNDFYQFVSQLVYDAHRMPSSEPAVEGGE